MQIGIPSLVTLISHFFYFASPPLPHPVRLPAMAPIDDIKNFSVLLLFQSLLIVTVCGLYIQSPQLGSSLTPLQNASWVSDDHVFALGFVDEGWQNYSLSIYYLQLPHQTVVWTANWGRTVSTKAFLELKNNGDLVLLDGAIQVWRTGTGDKGVTRATVSTSGILCLLNDTTPLWRSTDLLTDTLLPGQKMLAPSYLVDRKGRYVLAMQEDENLVLHFLGSLTGTEDHVAIGLVYWASGTVRQVTNGSAAVFDKSGNFMVQGPSGEVLATLIRQINVSNSVPQRLQLVESGVLILYVWQQDRQLWSSAQQIPGNPCEVPGQCGPYGICSLNSVQPHYSCDCPPGFHFRSNDSVAAGCMPNIPFNSSSGTQLVRFVGIQYNTLLRKYYDLKQGYTEQGCKEACDKDCYCMAAQFSDETCFLKTVGQIHSGNRANPAAVTYLRVSGFESSSNLQQTSAESNKAHLSTATTIGITSASALCAALILGHLAWCSVWLKRRRSEGISLDGSEEIPTYDAILGAPVRFSFRELQAATNRFREKLGKGGFGCVYKGVLAGGTAVAVKQLESLNQGGRQFQAEVATIGAIHHINLVRLRGFCAERSRKLLVYEFMENGSLNKHLFRSADKEHPRHHKLDWNTRVGVALGTAKAICYLHEECTPSIIHCDIKPENILLDRGFSPKVSDFGLAKLIAGDMLGSLSSVRGTAGYMAPEWTSPRHITVKVDAYSYGIVLLEIISGRRILDLQQRIYREWAYGELMLGNFGLMLDPTLEGQADMEQLERMAKIAFWCIQTDPNSRPSMNRVIQMLEGIVAVPLPPPPEGTKPLAAQTDSVLEGR